MITRTLGWAAIAAGLVVGLSDPTLSGTRLLGLLLITTGGVLLARLAHLARVTR